MGNRNHILTGAAHLAVDGVNLGFLDEGIKMTFSRDYFDVEVEQVKGVIRSDMISESLEISTTLSETDFEKLRIAWDQEGSTLLGGSFLNIGTEGGGLEHTLQIVTLAPASAGQTYRNITIYKAVQMDSGDQTFQRKESTKIPVKFKCLKDVLNNNKFGNMQLSNSAVVAF